MNVVDDSGAAYIVPAGRLFAMFDSEISYFNY
jgi:hypothetical protein